MLALAGFLLLSTHYVAASRLLNQASPQSAVSQGPSANFPRASLSASSCGSANVNYSYAVYSDKDSCTDRNNAACSPCNLWTRYLATPAAQQSCKQEMTVAGHWCDRRDWVTVVQVQQDHYVALPNQPVTGVEEWFKVDGADKFWGDVWAGAERVRKERNPAWTMDNLGIALNPSGSRDQHQMHFHLEALKPTWQTTFNSKSLPTDPKKAWPANQWVPLDGDRVLAKFVPSSGSAPTQISPFEEWRSAYEKVKISKGYPVHEVGLLVTKDSAGHGWFIALSDGAAETKFLA